MTKKSPYLKLKQGDRIEFLLLEQKINNDFVDFSPFSFLITMLWITIGIIAFGILMLPNYPESAMTLLKVSAKIFSIARLVFIVLLVGQITSWYVYFKNRRKLKQRFFKK